MIKVREVLARNLLAKSGIPSVDIVSNPYIGCPHKCVYCYAEFMKRFTGHLGETWGDFVDVKFCDSKITPRRAFGKTVMISSVTDPYNQFEKRYKKTRKLLEELLEAGANVEIITKSDLVLRDLDLLKKFISRDGKKSSVGVTFSFSTSDDSVAKLAEERSPAPSKRISALKLLKKEGIPAFAFISPILPEITDVDRLVKLLKNITDEIWFDSLNIHNPIVFRKVMNFIKEHFPNLVPLYREIYAEGMSGYWEDKRSEIEKICRKEKISFKIFI